MCAPLSLFLGSEGRYQLGGIDICFQKSESPPYDFYESDDPCAMKCVGYLAKSCLKNRLFKIATFGYLHILVHELGHALAYKICSGKSSTITVHSNFGMGETDYHHHHFKDQLLSPAAETFLDMAGPLADLIFSVALIFGAFLLQNYITPYATYFIAGGAGFWILGEFYYALNSALKADGGDFGKIRERSSLHLFIATAIMVAICASAALGLYYLNWR
jgi:hypothetical protein